MSHDYQLISDIEQFYYREARLLDERCFQQWLAIVDQSIEYSMPARHIPHPDPKAQDTEAYLSVERELDRADGGKGSPLRQDGYLQTFVRTFRPYKSTAWAESPAPRTRRSITNVELESVNDDEYHVRSNFFMYYSHEGKDNHTYSGGRKDVLKKVEGEFKLFKREVIIDWDIITVPSLALIF
ncbi:aromatic-ring-hydroxylating dioxygenase subunit beta [Pseudomaricurvus sp. HS19]|uniref:aromatic-ring-hydroxylating dioxygenase subunit beta n=1 Tax=Pseudomaricurvus sp. HS19 TaxID=2692626 RepID=UPI001367BD1C|nr:aromatic-ring-hydroxylating dioxygenase subunit beta [Pseudomaricurvus sp. HS19]MYM63121.1 hypothetical protein [Pseudomaricurvus sp. HS19]